MFERRLLPSWRDTAENSSRSGCSGFHSIVRCSCNFVHPTRIRFFFLWMYICKNASRQQPQSILLSSWIWININCLINVLEHVGLMNMHRKLQQKKLRQQLRWIWSHRCVCANTVIRPRRHGTRPSCALTICHQVMFGLRWPLDGRLLRYW